MSTAKNGLVRINDGFAKKSEMKCNWSISEEGRSFPCDEHATTIRIGRTIKGYIIRTPVCPKHRGKVNAPTKGQLFYVMQERPGAWLVMNASGTAITPAFKLKKEAQAALKELTQ